MNRLFRMEGFDLRRHRIGPLAPHIDGLAARLSEGQYQRETARKKIRVVADLSLWLKRRGLGPGSLDEQVVRRFFHRHHRYDQVRAGDVSAATVMLELLREQGVAPLRPSTETKPRHAVEEDFERYLREERRLSQASLDNALPFVQRFLSDRFRGSPVALQELHASDVTRFVLRSIDGISPSRAKLLAGALRSFFRFLRMRGEIAADLAGAVPTVANWRLSTVPKGIDPDDVRRLFRSCDRRTTAGRRDYAILLLLARLGLRSGEVASLTLEDIDWEAAELVIHGKDPRGRCVPEGHRRALALRSSISLRLTAAWGCEPRRAQADQLRFRRALTGGRSCPARARRTSVPGSRRPPADTASRPSPAFGRVHRAWGSQRSPPHAGIWRVPVPTLTRRAAPHELRPAPARDDDPLRCRGRTSRDLPRPSARAARVPRLRHPLAHGFLRVRCDVCRLERLVVAGR